MDEQNKENKPPAEKKKPPKYFCDRQPGDKGFSIGVVERYSKSHGRYLPYVPSDSEEESDSDDDETCYEEPTDEQETQWYGH